MSEHSSKIMRIGDFTESRATEDSASEMSGNELRHKSPGKRAEMDVRGDVSIKYCFLPVTKGDAVMAIPVVVIRNDSNETQLIPLKEDGSRHKGFAVHSPKRMLMWVADTLGFDVEFPKETGKDLAWHTILVEMVDFTDFSQVQEWRSPAIANAHKKPHKTLPKPFITEAWRTTVVKAYQVLKLWGETNVVAQPGDLNVEGGHVEQPSAPSTTPVTGMQKVDSFVNILTDAVKSFKTVATERDEFAKDISVFEKRVRELSANKIVIETKLFDTTERESRLAIRLSEVEAQVADLMQKLRAAEACSNERSSVIDRLKSLIDPLRRAVTDMGL